MAIFGLGATALITLNEAMENIMKIAKSHEKPGLLINQVLKELNMRRKNKEVDFSQCY